VGAPGTWGTVFSLATNFDNREIRAVGCDANADVVGRRICCKFHQVPRGDEEGFIDEIQRICILEDIDVILPQCTSELEPLAKAKDTLKNQGTVVATSDYEAVVLANNKCALMRVAEEARVPIPEHGLARNFEELETLAFKLGYPEKPIVVKPPVSRGMRGLRIIDSKLERSNLFWTEKPSGIEVTLDDLKFLEKSDWLSPLLVMEHLPGREYSVDVLANAGHTVVAVPRSRDSLRSGITFTGSTDPVPELIEYAERLTARIGLSYAFGFQFKQDCEGQHRLIECNPRIQGSMFLTVGSGANIIYGAVKLALNEALPDFKVKWGSRMFRYWGMVIEKEIVER